MFHFGEQIEGLLRQTSASVVTETVILVLIAVFLLAIVQARQGKWSGFVSYTPNLLTSLGILGTFIGIVVGLLAFDVHDIDGSIAPLLDGLKTAFITSLVGMALAIVFKAADSSGRLRKQEVASEAEEIGPEEIFGELRAQRESLNRLGNAISGDEESTLITQIRLLRSDGQDQAKSALEQLRVQSSLQDSLSRNVKRQQEGFETFTAELWKKLDGFAEMLSKSATEQVISALREVIADFNNNLTEQFGENFKELNAAVGKLIEWQENYRDQLAQMGQQYEQGVQAISQTQEAVTRIGEETKQIPATMADLKTVLETTQHQLAELERHLEAFRDMRDRAVEAVPQIREQMDGMVRDVSEAVKGAGEQITNASKAVNEAIVAGAEEFRNNVNRTNEGLVSASDQLASNSEKIREQFDDTVKDVNEHVRNLVATVTEQSKEVSSTLIESNQQLQAQTKEVQSQVTDSIEQMQKRLESALEQIFQAQTREMNRAFEAVNEELRKSVGTTGDAVNKQLQAMDTAMQQEVERVMNEMGRALATISGRFTSDYSRLVDAMAQVVRENERMQA